MQTINIQPIEKRQITDGDTLQVHSIFYTLQGEGPFAGRPAIFIRLAGCNLKCPSCFVAKTKIRMADGSQKQISEIKIGDRVLSYNEVSGNFESKKVLNVMKRQTDSILRIYTGTRETGNGGNPTDLIFCTKEHPFLVKNKGWTKAENLKKEDILLHYTQSDHMRLFNSIKKPGAIEKLKDFQKSFEGIQAMQRMHSAAEAVREITSENASIRMIKNNPMFDPNIVIKSFLSRKDRGHKTIAEKKFETIIKGLPVKFVGDGALIISHKIPDFIVIGQKKVIEVWSSDAPHAVTRDQTWKDQRELRFKKEGYETLFIGIPDKNVNSDLIRKQVQDFIHNGEIIKNIDNIPFGSKSWVRLAGSDKNLIDVYNLEVEDLHTYIANGKIVHNCDTDYTSKRMQMHINGILVSAMMTYNFIGTPKPIIVISGGEPFRQNIGPLTNLLAAEGYTVQIETNGTLPPSENLHPKTVIVCSPKTGKINPAIAHMATCFKYVMSWDSVDPEDGLPILALNHTASPRVARPPKGINADIYLQPMDAGGDISTNHRNVEAVKASCLKFGYRLQLQLHKLLGME